MMGDLMFRNILKIVLLVAIALSTMGNASTIKSPDKNDGPLIIPLDLSSQRPVLEVMIGDNGPYKFIFDTGSGTNVIDTDLADELECEVIGLDTLFTPGSDNRRVSKRVNVSTINFANTTISEDAVMNTVPIRKMVAVDGIISPVLFSNYLLTINYPGSNLMLRVGDLDKSEKGVMSYLQKSRIINLTISVDGHQLEAHLDSGNPGGFDLPLSMKDKLKFKEDPYEDGVINTPVASFRKWKATLDGKITVGDISYENPDVNLVENFEVVNLGYRFFKELSITIDKKNSLIKFEKSTNRRPDNTKEEEQGEQNEYTGWYGGNERRIFLEDGEMYLQRGGAPKLKLVKLGDNLYEMVFPMPVTNELPNISFNRDETGKVIGLTFHFEDGREDFVKKDK